MKKVVYSESMKNINNIISLIALLILIALGWYLFSEQKKFETKNIETHTVVIDGEEVYIEYPLVHSFSNEKSNIDVPAPTRIFSTPSVYTAVQSTVQSVSQPFTFGLYYINNILEKGIDECKGRFTTENVELSVYDSSQDLTLTRIEMTHDNAYLFVEAKETPKEICAYIMQFKDISTHFFKGIHIIFQ